LELVDLAVSVGVPQPGGSVDASGGQDSSISRAEGNRGYFTWIWFSQHAFLLARGDAPKPG
jgi:hypothetical protein